MNALRRRWPRPWAPSWHKVPDPDAGPPQEPTAQLSDVDFSNTILLSGSRR